MQFKKFACLALILTLTVSLELQSSIQGGGFQCYYQVLQSQQKFSFDVVALNHVQQFQVQISRYSQSKQKWDHIFERTAQNFINVHKLAPKYGNYEFCILNDKQEQLNYLMKLAHGMQLVQLSLLPDKSDAEYLTEQLSYIEENKEYIFSIMDRNHGMRDVANNLTHMMSSKMFGITALCTVLVLLFNGLIFREIQAALKNRKLI